MYKHIVILLFFINISICQEIYPYVSPGFTLSFNENKSGLSLKNINISYDISIGCQMNIMHVKLGFGKQNLSSKDYSIRYYYIGGGALIGGFEKGIAVTKKDNKKILGQRQNWYYMSPSSWKIVPIHVIGFMYGGLVTINGMGNPYPVIFQTKETFIFPDSTYKVNRKIIKTHFMIPIDHIDSDMGTPICDIKNREICF
tara:strand:+ start:146 stop:742 length:597 start_codon:yes stop_codon:yes gene_type:complete